MAGASFTNSSLAGLNQMISVLFKDSFGKAQENLPYQLVTTDLGKSNAQTRGLDWLGTAPAMTAVGSDSTTYSAIKRYSHSLTHTEYRAALRVRISDLETDNQGQIPPRIANMARKAAAHPGQLAFDQLEANPTGYDSAAYFANTHAFGEAANIDNLAGGTGTTTAAIETDIATNRNTMMRFQDDTGNAMELVPDTIVIPPQLSSVFAKVLGGFRDAGGTDSQLGVVDPSQGNVWKAGGYTVIELARLTDANNWYLFHTKGEIKPFVYSWITQPRVLNSPSFNDDSAKNHGVLEYVVYGEYAVQVTLPHYGICVVN